MVGCRIRWGYREREREGERERICFNSRLYILIEIGDYLDNKSSVDEDVVQIECNLHVWNMWVQQCISLVRENCYKAKDTMPVLFASVTISLTYQ